ncbi:hypothetical protein F4604DRAFT_1906791 [Suillus subluteus]|nr:hypothetical protein F4604DRAFT_1906791 [Suillus subluteus]
MPSLQVSVSSLCQRYPGVTEGGLLAAKGVLGIRLLAAHIYHRAFLTVPALIRAWISDCSDRQLLPLSRVVGYTASYFSPGIIRAELAQVRQADPSGRLSSVSESRRDSNTTYNDLNAERKDHWPTDGASVPTYVYWRKGRTGRDYDLWCALTYLCQEYWAIEGWDRMMWRPRFKYRWRATGRRRANKRGCQEGLQPMREVARNKGDGA